jgi:hypothetical protein
VSDHLVHLEDGFILSETTVEAIVAGLSYLAGHREKLYAMGRAALEKSATWSVDAFEQQLGLHQVFQTGGN